MVQEKIYGYDAALRDSVFYVVPDGGCIQLTGQDRVDFLQRQTTNDVRMLSETRGVRTVLTSPTARILDVLWLICEPDAIHILTLPGHGSPTAAFLRSKIFFMDKVAVTDQSGKTTQIDLAGQTLAENLRKLGTTLPEIDQITSTEVDGVRVTLIGRRGLSGAGACLLIEKVDEEKILDVLRDRGFVELSSQASEALRIEVGLPGIRELTEEYTPLEVHLNDAISDSKGCYTGQEIIARQITYEKVTRTLVGLRLDGPVEQGAVVRAENRNIGTVTSAVESPRFGWIALAVLKRPHNEPDAEVEADAESRTVNGRVSMLPFS